MNLNRKIFLTALWAFCAAILMPLCGGKTAEAAPAANFDITKIPVTNKPLGEFPFFTPPEGLEYVNFRGSKLVKKDSQKDFDNYPFATGEKTLHFVDGKTFHVSLQDVKRKSSTDLDALVIQRNYQNAITAAGGVKVFDGQIDRNAYNALDQSDTARLGHVSSKRQTYVIRRADAEVWIQVSCIVGRCDLAVAQKGEMKQTVGLIPASEMKAALDKNGHVALYINFDVDKASIRPESEPIIAEIVKLLEENPGLKIRIEGHTDNTGSAAHNQTLSEKRAAAVYGSLLAKGIAQSRLQSAGFGASKPIADNATEEGKAKNRRVEIVKL
jgi:outer membrane protein OmpA-like peptidoglycan-associated protein